MCPSCKKDNNHAKRHPTCSPHPWGDDSVGEIKEMSGVFEGGRCFIVLCSSSGERALRWFFDVGRRGEMREFGLGGVYIIIL